MSLDEDIVSLDPPENLETPLDNEIRRWLYENFSRLRERFAPSHNVSGTFTTTDGKTITVLNGVITSIV